MSYLHIKDERGRPMIISLKRFRKASVADVGAANSDGISMITLEGATKDDPDEVIYSTTPVEELWDQIRMRLV